MTQEHPMTTLLYPLDDLPRVPAGSPRKTVQCPTCRGRYLRLDGTPCPACNTDGAADFLDVSPPPFTPDGFPTRVDAFPILASLIARGLGADPADALTVHAALIPGTEPWERRDEHGNYLDDGPGDLPYLLLTTDGGQEWRWLLCDLDESLDESHEHADRLALIAVARQVFSSRSRA